MSQDPAFSQRFIVEAREHLAAMTSAMIALERDQASPQPAVEQLLRAAHSIKGGAGFTGRRNIERLAHAMEEVIENIRDGKIARSPEVVDMLLAVLDRITVMVDDVDHSDEADISESLARLQPLVGAGNDQNLPSQPTPQPTALAREFPLSNRVIASWQADTSFLYGIKFDWFQCEQQFDLSTLDVTQRIEQVGSVLESQTEPSGPTLAEGLPQSPLWCVAVVSSSLELKQFTETLNIPCASIVPLREKSPAHENRTPPPTETRAKTATGATSLRISVPLVDRMMALAGELVLVRNQAMRSSDPANSPLRRLLRRLDSVTNELQDAALRMRTQPVGTLFDKFPRVVRDLARQLGKKIDVQITGSEVELDKTILELLADPMTHLIRNCCDHGIEAPDQRAREGKPPSGHIALAARQERGQIVIEVRDDGRGIDPDAVKRKAREQGLRRADELDRLSERQVYDLILLSGFSTAARVTDVSGRGVGMDVVKTNLDQIGGVVEIDSALGKGTVFTMRLPLTLAIMPCLLLASDGQCYGVPQRDVEAIVLLDAGGTQRGIERNHEGEVLRWRERLLPVIRLREVLRRRQPFDAAALAEIAERYQRSESGPVKSYAAVLGLGSRKFVLVFDEVQGSENIVVKPLHPMLRPLGIYAATTLLAEGNVALILSSEGVARHSGVFGRPVIEDAPALPAPAGDVEARPIMLFRSGSDELLATALNSIRRVVMITTDRIERIGDRELVNVDGAATNVLRLDRLLNVSPCSDSGRLFLVLPRNMTSPVGLLVSEIVDTPTLAMRLDDRAYQVDGVLGTAMIRGEIALVIDVERVVKMWEQMHQLTPAALPEKSRKKILVVDDTQFFRKLVSEHVRNAGHEASVASNGSEGLAVLKTGQFDLVICDIEMPVMDGLEFARQVRADPRLAGIPLIALTTLNTPESRAAAMEAGFDLYEVKLDRKTLMASVGDLLARPGTSTALPGARTDA